MKNRNNFDVFICLLNWKEFKIIISFSVGEVAMKWTACNFVSRGINWQTISFSFLLLSLVILTLSFLPPPVLIETHCFSHELLPSPLCYFPSFQSSSPKVYPVLYSRTLCLKDRPYQVDPCRNIPTQIPHCLETNSRFLSMTFKAFLIWSLSDLFNLISYQTIWVQILAPVPTSHVIFVKVLNTSLHFTVLSCKVGITTAPFYRLLKVARVDVT